MSNELSIFGQYNAEDDFKDMRQEDKILPRLSLMQFQSKPVRERKAQAGDWYDSSKETVVCPGSKITKIIPVTWWHEWIEWNPDRSAPKDKKILNRSLDPNGELSRLSASRIKVTSVDNNGVQKEVFKVTEVYNVLALVPEYTGNYEDLMLLSLSRTAHFPCKQWLNRMSAFRFEGQKVPMYFGAWELGSKMETKNGQDFMVPTFGRGELVDKSLFDLIGNLAQQCKAQKAALQERAAKTAAEDETHEDAPPMRQDI